MKQNKPKQCLCGKSKLWSQCCGRFLEHNQLAKTAEQLMRSRYSAYALGGCGDYLLKTWFPATANDLSADILSIKELDWCGLEILSKSQQGDEATVEFKAWYRSDEEGAVVYQGQPCKFLHEHSVFSRVAGRWLYVGGEIFSSPP